VIAYNKFRDVVVSSWLRFENMAVFERSFVVHTPLEFVWKFHSDPVALTKITPRPIRVRIRRWDDPIQNGSRVLMRLSLGPLAIRWDSVLKDYIALRPFTDEQIPGQGPFATWRHTHHFEPAETGTVVTDHVEYEKPLGVLDHIADHVLGKLLIKAMFSARARATKACLERHNRPGDGVNVHTATLGRGRA
jgi:ligand-binding SRPBCC domain-containing protein